MAPPLLEVTGLSKRFGGFVALDGIDLTVAEGERVGLIGPNGSGKSTLVNCICGTLVNETGTVRFDGEAVDGLLTHERTRRGMARRFQLPRPFATLTVAEGERVGLIGPNGSGKSTLVNCICGTLVNESGSVRFNGETVDGLLTHERTRRGMARSFQLPRPFTTLTVADNLRVPLLYTVNARPGHALSPTELDARCAELLQLVALADKARHLPRDLTQVEMRKLELARAMAAEPKLLIADEAMAGLSQSEVDDIVGLLIRLNEHGITIILIEHIMRAVMKFSQRLIVLVSGKKIADGMPDAVIRDPAVERAYIGQ